MQNFYQNQEALKHSSSSLQNVYSKTFPFLYRFLFLVGWRKVVSRQLKTLSFFKVFFVLALCVCVWNELAFVFLLPTAIKLSVEFMCCDNLQLY